MRHPAWDIGCVALRHFVPLPILELSHLLGSAVGVGLLVLAHGLYRRLDAAWYLTMWLLCAGVLLSLLKGFDYEEAVILGAVAVALVSGRSRFRRRASLIEQRFSVSWVVAVLLVLGAAVWLVLFAYRHVPYSNELWWQFAFEAPAPRSLRALLLAAMTAAAYALYRLLRPSKPAMLPPSQTDLERAAAIIENAHDASANLALLGDKNLLFNPERTAFIMYQASGSSWVSMGDPVGPSSLYEPLVWTFVENCDGMAVEPVFYQISPENLPLYIDLGLTLSKLGEEARVPLDTFSLEGAARADLRHPHRRAKKDGAEFEVVPRAKIGAIMPELREVSNAWLSAKNTAEKRFSLGYFDERYLSHFDIAVVRRAGAIVAFANILRAGADTELSADLMRYNDAAPKGVIDFLLVECMLWGKALRLSVVQLGDGAAVGSRRACARAHVAQARTHGAALWRDVLSVRGPAQVQGEIPAGMAPTLSRGAGRLGDGRRLARRHLADLGRGEQSLDQVGQGIAVMMKSFATRSANGALLLAVGSMAISAAAAPPGDVAPPSPSAPSAPSSAPQIEPSAVFTYERFGKVSVYRPRGEPREVVLFLSGDGGWTLGVLTMTRRLVEQGASSPASTTVTTWPSSSGRRTNAYLRRSISRI